MQRRTAVTGSEHTQQQGVCGPCVRRDARFKAFWVRFLCRNGITFCRGPVHTVIYIRITCRGPLGNKPCASLMILSCVVYIETLLRLVLSTEEARANNPCCFRLVEKLELTLLQLLQRTWAVYTRKLLFVSYAATARGNDWPSHFVVRVAFAVLGRFKS